jgi:hypothetical protein
MQAISCPVCWGQLEKADTGCPRCQTPHHEECFAFTGGCAVFGCGGKVMGAIQFHAPALELTESGADFSQERPGGPPREPGLPRGMVRRVADAWWCLFKNWKLAIAMALVTATVQSTGALMMGNLPATGESRAAMVGTSTPRLDRVREARQNENRRFDPRGGPRATRRAAQAPEFGAPTASVVGGGLLLVVGQLVLPIFFAVLTVVVLFSRARGKEFEPGEFVGMAVGRMGRVVKYWFLGMIQIVLPYVLAICFSCFTQSGLFIGLVAIAGLFWVLYMFNDISLFLPVAAMGVDEEPESPLTRSRKLVALGRAQVFFGNGLCSFVMTFVIMVAMFFLGFTSAFLPKIFWLRFGWEYTGMIFTSFFTLLMPIYQALLYFEARRALDGGFLKFAPTEVTGGRGQ